MARASSLKSVCDTSIVPGMTSHEHFFSPPKQTHIWRHHAAFLRAGSTPTDSPRFRHNSRNLSRPWSRAGTGQAQHSLRSVTASTGETAAGKCSQEVYWERDHSTTHRSPNVPCWGSAAQTPEQLCRVPSSDEALQRGDGQSVSLSATSRPLLPLKMERSWKFLPSIIWSASLR